MKITLILLILGLCLVSAKYLPYESDNTNGVLLRDKRSDSEESDSSIDHDSNEESDGDDSVEKKLREREEKRREKEEKEKRKALERAEKEKHREEELRRKEEERKQKLEEKQEKEERKHQEKLVKERRKQEEHQRKLEEKRLKEERKKQEKEINELRKEAIKNQIQGDSFLDTEEENSVELEDIWRQHIYTKYGLNFASTRLEKQAALNKYIQEELRLQPNSTKSERRQAILNLIQTKLQNDAAEREALRKQILSHVNAVTFQKLRDDLENDIQEIQNKTDLLKNVQLPWAVSVQQNLEEKRIFLQGLLQFLANILPNWTSNNQPQTSTPIDAETNAQNSDSNSDVLVSSGNGALPSESSITVSNGENADATGNNNNELANLNGQATSVTYAPIIGNDNVPNNAAVDEATTGNMKPVSENTDLQTEAKPDSNGESFAVSQGNTQDSSLPENSQIEQSDVTSDTVAGSSNNNEPLQNEANSNSDSGQSLPNSGYVPISTGSSGDNVNQEVTENNESSTINQSDMENTPVADNNNIESQPAPIDPNTPIQNTVNTSSSLPNSEVANDEVNQENMLTENTILDTITEKNNVAIEDYPSNIPANNQESINGEFNNNVGTNEGVLSSNIDIISATESVISNNESVDTPNINQSQDNSGINGNAADSTPEAETVQSSSNSISDTNKDTSSVVQESLTTTTSDVLEVVTEVNNANDDSIKPINNEDENSVQSNLTIDSESTTDIYTSVVPDVSQATTAEINEVANEETVNIESQTVAAELVTEVLPSTDVIQSGQGELIEEKKNTEAPQTETTEFVPLNPIDDVIENYTVDAEPGATIVDIVAQ